MFTSSDFPASMIESILYRQSTIPIMVDIDGRSPCIALGIQRLTHRDDLLGCLVLAAEQFFTHVTEKIE
jgi:hypothetical protein